MIQQSREQELKDRLNLIEAMIAEGRQTTASWGWAFVLWGIAYYVAIAWSIWGNANIAWPVTMIGASVITGILATRQSKREPGTTMGRAIAGVWICLGISLFVFGLCINLGGHAEQHNFLAAIEIMLGAANGISSIILKWKPQFLSALTWWLAAALTCFATISQSYIIFLIAIFLGQIVFGAYIMIAEARERKQSVAHA
jgi:hypothetical protein